MTDNLKRQKAALERIYGNLMRERSKQAVEVSKHETSSNEWWVEYRIWGYLNEAMDRVREAIKKIDNKSI